MLKYFWKKIFYDKGNNNYYFEQLSDLNILNIRLVYNLLK